MVSNLGRAIIYSLRHSSMLLTDERQNDWNDEANHDDDDDDDKSTIALLYGR